MQGGVHLDDRLLDGYSAFRGGRQPAHLRATDHRQLLNAFAVPSLSPLRTPREDGCQLDYRVSSVKSCLRFARSVVAVGVVVEGDGGNWLGCVVLLPQQDFVT
jgi:hypothetical protein